MTRTIASALAAGLIATASISPAHAQEKTASRGVSYADLDLTHPEDVHILKQRVRDTAKALCGEPDTRNLNPYNDIWSCRAEAIAGARSQISRAVSRAKQLASSKASGGAPVQTSAR